MASGKMPGFKARVALKTKVWGKCLFDSSMPDHGLLETIDHQTFFGLRKTFAVYFG